MCVRDPRYRSTIGNVGKTSTSLVIMAPKAHSFSNNHYRYGVLRDNLQHNDLK